MFREAALNAGISNYKVPVFEDGGVTSFEEIYGSVNSPEISNRIELVENSLKMIDDMLENNELTCNENDTNKTLDSAREIGIKSAIKRTLREIDENENRRIITCPGLEKEK